MGREAFEGLESTGEVAGGHEFGEECSQLIVAILMEAFDGRVFDRAVHPLDRTVRGDLIHWIKS